MPGYSTINQRVSIGGHVWHLRVLSDKQQFADPDEAGIGHRADAQIAGDFTAQVAGDLIQALDRTADRLDLADQPGAGGSEFHAAGSALEQAQSQPFFQRLDVITDGWLTEMQSLCSPRQVAGLGDGEESSELVELDSHG